MYKIMKDPKGRFGLITIRNEGQQIIRKTFKQEGYFDKNILCDNCDNHIMGSNERYVSHVIYGGTLLSITPLQSTDGIQSELVKNIDYKKFKLCFLGILWKCSVSKQKFFDSIELGLEEKVISNMLLKNDSGNLDKFRISIARIFRHDGKPITLLPKPTIIKDHENHFAVYFINGFCYFIDISGESKFPLFGKTSLSESGEIEILHLKNQFAYQFLLNLGVPPIMIDQLKHTF